MTLQENEFQSSTDKAYACIYNMILTGELKPGEKLIRRKLAGISKVSTIPVLEALLRLEADGLVESMPYRGSRVVKVTYEKILDWYALREAVECQVVRIISLKLNDHDIQSLEALAHRLDEMENKGDVGEKFRELHHELHINLAKFTGHKSLIDALKRINLFTLLQRAQSSAQEHRSQIPKDNHMRLLIALKQKDPQIAEDVMREHILHSGIYDQDGKLVENLSPVY